jgi:hypothetical protein
MNKKEYLKWIQDEIDDRRKELDRIISENPSGSMLGSVALRKHDLEVEIGIYKKCYNRSVGR